MRALLFLVLVLNFACAHKMYIQPENSVLNEKAGIEGSLIWMKNKKKKMDANIRLTNNYKNAVLVEDNATSITFEGQKQTRVVSPNRRMILREGETRVFIVTMGFDPMAQEFGSGEVRIENMYSYKNDKQGKKLAPLVMPFKIDASLAK